MINASGAAGPPGYGGASEDTVGEQNPPEHETPDYEAEYETPGYEGGPEGKSELGNPPSVLEKELHTEHPDDLPIGVPVDQTE
ncbi:MAG: hypothetical protein QM820_55890 [Minicystis sp.]